MRTNIKGGGGEHISDAVSRIRDSFIEEAETGFSPERAASRVKIRRILVIAAALAALTVIAASAFVIIKTASNRYNFNRTGSAGNYETLPEELHGAVISAEGASGRLIGTGSAFLLHCGKNATAELIASYLTIAPATDYSIAETKKGEFKITPASGKLDEDTVYRLTLGDPENPAVSFAFQTESEFRIKSFFPADYSTNVPIDTAIVVEFSEPVTEDAFEMVTISPSADGEFLLTGGGRSVVFLPGEWLPYNTEFTVTIESEIESTSGKELGTGRSVRFLTASEEAQAGAGITGRNSTSAWTDTVKYFTPGQPVELTLRVSTPDYWSAEAVLYRFPSARDAYGAALDLIASAGQKELPKSFYDSRLEKCGRASASGTGNSLTTVLSFEEEYGKGIYLALIDVDVAGGASGAQTFRAYSFIDVTESTSFVLSDSGETLVWTLLAENGSPVNGAAVSGICFDRPEYATGWNTDLEKSAEFSGKTDSDGIFRFNNEYGAALMLVSGVTGDELVYAKCSPEKAGLQYLGYAYTDRQSYRSKDTVNMWGYVAYRDGGYPDEVYITFRGAQGRKAVAVSDNGTFRTSFVIDSPVKGSMSALISDADGNIICGRYFEYSDDPYPDYDIKITFDKAVFLPGEMITGSVTVALFDGTPVGDIVVDVWPAADDKPVYATVVTDDSGVARFSFSPSYTDSDYLQGRTSVYVRCCAVVTGADRGRDQSYAVVYYIPSAYILHQEAIGGRKFIFINERDLEASVAFIESADIGKNWGDFKKFYAAEVSGKTIGYKLERFWTEKTTSTYYDPYTGKSVTRTYSTNMEEVVSSGTLTFENGRIDFTDLYPEEKIEGSTYRLTFTFENDSNGRTESFGDFVLKSDIINSLKENEPAAEPVSSTPELKTGSERYALGSDFVLEMTKGGKRVGGLIGWYTCSLGDVVFSAGRERFDFDSSMMRENCLGFGIYYDTELRQFHLTSAYVNFDFESECSFEPEITTDKSVYRPGERAVISVRVKGGAGASVLVSVTDEACFSVANQNEQLFRTFRSSFRSNKPVFNYRYALYSAALGRGRTSNDNPNESGDAISSSGYESVNPSTYVRRDFADNAAFSELTLDAEGNGTLVMTVPDNITRWRVTVLAVSIPEDVNDPIKAGSAVSEMISTQELIANVGIYPEYLERDNVIISVSALGNAASGEVGFSGEIRSASGRVVASASASAEGHGYTSLDFGKLEAGEYKVTVCAVCADKSDALEKKITVIESAAVYRVVKFISPDEIASLNPASYPLTLTFINRTESGGVFDKILSKLSRGTAGRSDASVAAYVAALTENRAYGSGEPRFRPEISFNFPNQITQNHEYYPSVFPYSEGSLELFAKILAAASSDVIDESRVSDEITLLYGKVGSKTPTDPGEICSALVCLAALDEPVLDLLDAAAREANRLPTDARLLLALAYAVSGDNPAAESLLSFVMRTAGFTDEKTGVAYVGKDPDERGRLTELALLTASRCDRKLALSLAGYLLGAENSDLYRLGLASYVRFYLPCELPPTAEVEYTVDGLTNVRSLRAGESFSVVLSRTEHQSFRIDRTDGDVAIRASYSGDVSELPDGGQAKSMLIEKTFTQTRVIDGCRNVVVTVTVTVAGVKDSDTFIFDDFLPTGTAFISFADTGDVHLSVSGRHVSGYFRIHGRSDSEGNPLQQSVTFSYVIRGVLEGEFETDPPSVVKLSNGSCRLGPAHTVKINRAKSFRSVEKK